MVSSSLTDQTLDWAEFHRRSQGRPRRELLDRTVACFEIEGRPPGVAVDLGCGAGAETLELLRRGWQVHAVDADAAGLEMLKGLPESARSALTLHAVRFEAFDFPECDLIWAGYSWPYCRPDAWPTLWHRMVKALRPNGRIAGDVFGDQHAWAHEPAVLALTEASVRALLAGMVVETFDIEDGIRPSAGALTRWHAFGIAARKPGPPFPTN